MITIKQKIEVVRQVENGRLLRDVPADYGVGISTVSYSNVIPGVLLHVSPDISLVFHVPLELRLFHIRKNLKF